MAEGLTMLMNGCPDMHPSGPDEVTRVFDSNTHDTNRLLPTYSIVKEPETAL
jgi:hypothetical protein